MELDEPAKQLAAAVLAKQACGARVREHGDGPAGEAGLLQAAGQTGGPAGVVLQLLSTRRHAWAAGPNGDPAQPHPAPRTPRTCMCLAGMDHSCCSRMAAERSSQSISSVTALTSLGEAPKKEANMLSGTCSIDASSTFTHSHQPLGALSRSACSTSAGPNLNEDERDS